MADYSEMKRTQDLLSKQNRTKEEEEELKKLKAEAYKRTTERAKAAGGTKQGMFQKLFGGGQ